jgi:spermidine/putrescine-binding protein
MGFTTTRRRLLGAGAAGAGLTLIGTGPRAQDLRFDGVTLRFATFGGGWEQAIQDFIGVEFEKRGGKMQYVLAPPRDSLARLIAARGRDIPFDVVEMGDTTWVDTKEGGFIEPIDLANIPNTKDLLPGQFDEFKVGSWMTQEGIIYDVDKLKEQGVNVPTRYRDLLDPKLANKISMIDVTQVGSVQFIVGAAIDEGGSVDKLDKGFDLLKQLKVARFWKLGAESLATMQAGDAWVSTMHAGFAIQQRRNNRNYGFVHPVCGRNRGILKEGFLGVVKGTKVKRAAEFFINAYIDAQAQEKLALRRGIVPVNKHARAELKKDPLLAEMLLLDDKDVENMVRVDFSKVDIVQFTDRWTRSIAR